VASKFNKKLKQIQTVAMVDPRKGDC